jgi:hypothetical protein
MQGLKPLQSDIQHFQLFVSHSKQKMSPVVRNRSITAKCWRDTKKKNKRKYTSLLSVPPFHLNFDTYALSDDPYGRHVVSHTGVTNLGNLFVKLEIVTLGSAFNKKPTRLDFWFCF